MTNLRIGTSGWNYPSGPGTWDGVFYPPKAGRQRGTRAARPRGRFDELAYYAEHFDTVEVNNTFYRPPNPDVARSWAQRTPDGFEFSLKLYQKFTHPAMYRNATGDDSGRLSNQDVDDFRRGIDPLRDAGKLGALLVQFPASFKSTTQTVDHLAWLLDVFREYEVAVELRHRSWSDDLKTTLTVLNGFGAAWTQIDEPKFRVSIRQNFLPNVKGFYYMRLHGRNAEKWWRHEHRDDRYDYFYSAEELKPFAETAGAARTLVRKLYMYFNNHFAAKAVANAVQVKHQLGLDVPGDYPPEFVARYPELRGIVSTSKAPTLLHTSS
jgi:uncharacterized protein YecE (DUF72 family)